MALRSGYERYASCAEYQGYERGGFSFSTVFKRPVGEAASQGPLSLD